MTDLIWLHSEVGERILLLLMLLGLTCEINAKEVVGVKQKHNLRHLQYFSEH